MTNYGAGAYLELCEKVNEGNLDGSTYRLAVCGLIDPGGIGIADEFLYMLGLTHSLFFFLFFSERKGGYAYLSGPIHSLGISETHQRTRETCGNSQIP